MDKQQQAGAGLSRLPFLHRPAGHDHAADRLVGVEGLQRGAKLVHQLVVERVELLGAVQRDDAHAAFGAQGDEFGRMAHGFSSGVFQHGKAGHYTEPPCGKTLADRLVG